MADELITIAELPDFTLPVDVSTTFMEVEDNIDSENPVARRLLLQDIPNLFSGDIIVVAKEADLGTPVGGVITLLANTAYLVTTSISTASQLAMSEGTALFGYAPTVSGLTYTGTQSAFIVAGAIAFSIARMTITTAAAKRAIDYTGTGAPAGSLLYIRNCMIHTGSGLYLTDAGIILADTVIIATSAGISFFGSNTSFISMSTCQIVSSGSCIDFGSTTLVEVNLRVSNLTTTGIGYCIEGVASSGNIPAGNIAEFRDTDFAPAIPANALQGIVEDDIRYEFVGCTGVENTVRGASNYLGSPRTVPIVSATVFEVVDGGDWITESDSHFSVASDGSIEYLGELPRRFIIGMNAAVSKIGGGSDVIEQRIGISTDGGTTWLAEPRTGMVTQSSDPTGVFSQGQFLLNQGDKLTSMVANMGSTSDVLVDRSSVLVNSV
jgi:hypothetical protein